MRLRHRLNSLEKSLFLWFFWGTKYGVLRHVNLISILIRITISSTDPFKFCFILTNIIIQ
jgi:hypothetical protein